MTHKPTKHLRILATAPCTRGFGYAVMEEPKSLVDWGIRSVKGDKNAQSLVHVEAMIALYQPTVLVLQDHLDEDFRRSPRVRKLIAELNALARRRKVSVKRFSNAEVRTTLCGDKEKTKHDVAVKLADEFPEELASRLPPKRRAWTSEPYQMAIFDAVALARVCRLRNG
jgi:hypothetical protein